MPPIGVINVSDFTGGLNLRRDPFQLAANESPELMNVDVDPRGGFRQRKVVTPFGNALAADAHSLLAYQTTTGTNQIIVGVGTTVYRGTGSTWTSIATQANSNRCRGVTFKDVLYVQNGTDQPLRWDGSTASRLAQTFNDTDTPNNGDMPIGKCITVWMGCVWVANLSESGPKPNRVRFSHPNFPEDFKSWQFFDVDTGSDGDVITALVPYGDRLLIFKKRSVHAVYGTSPDTFSVLPVSQEVGAVSQEAVVNTDVGVFFMSWPEGVFSYRGRAPEWVFERLFPAIQDGSISDANQDKITLGWGNRRLWVSVPFSSSTPNRCLVLDPTLGKYGAWVQYDLPLGPFHEWTPPGSDTIFLGAGVGKSRLVMLDQNGAADNFGAGDAHVTSYYRTRWVDMGQAATYKRWKRPDIVLRGGTTATMEVDAFLDYDPSTALRHFRVSSTADPATLVWGTGQWGVGVWGRNDQARNAIARGAPLGSARSVALKFVGPTTNSEWGVNSIAFKVIPKKVRG